MRYTQENARILAIDECAPGIYNCTLSAPRIAASASVGQFVGVLCEGYTLRRPISLCGFDASLGILRLVFEVRGKGTAWMAKRQAGESFDLIGPLGHGFPLLDPSKKAVLVGGGIGTPPLLPLAQHYGENAVVIPGFRCGTSAILTDDFTAAGAQVILCTDDGSAGFHGFTTQALQTWLDAHTCDVIYTCGPKMMMKGTAELAAARGIDCYVSMEERMGCGVGACLGCACMTQDEDGADHMVRVCLNGPVFDGKEVVWG
ncbi:MAG: dihydroorotate dehydrogenase electron transfer subunit [Clostridiales bacterium]|nr:dihydroorotate dehydrogenase electron transfer subunit [Clostridiales bacterium]